MGKCDWFNKNEQVILIEQFRHGTEEVFLEIPDGTIDEGEEPIIAAARELIEERVLRHLK